MRGTTQAFPGLCRWSELGRIPLLLHHHPWVFVRPAGHSMALSLWIILMTDLHLHTGDEQCSVCLPPPVSISIKRHHWRGFCEAAMELCVGRAHGDVCAAQLFIPHFCIYKRLIQEAPATQGKQLFGDSSILLLFFFLVVFQALSLLSFFSCRGVWGREHEG